MSKYKYDFTLDTAERNFSLTGLASRVQPKQRVLELGCSYGYLSKFLTDELGCTVVGVDFDADAINHAAPFCKQVIVADLDTGEWLSEIEGQQFDVILCADVLEHLKDPASLLRSLKPFLQTGGRILASVPNVAHASVRLELLQGHFDYESLGILDDTHLHFYTRDGLITMLMQAGYLCNDIAYSTRDLADETIEQSFAVMGLQASEKTYQLLRASDALAYQFIIEAIPAKSELLQNVPQALSPKPLVSTGVYYEELRELIASLTVHNENNEANAARLEEKVSAVEKQLDAEKVHNENHEANAARLEEKVSTIEQQLEVERVHNKNHVEHIRRLEGQLLVIDNLDAELFRLGGMVSLNDQDIQNLQEQNYQLQERATHQKNTAEHLERVLQRVHGKVSYRAFRLLKNSLKIMGNLIQFKRRPKDGLIRVPEVNHHDYSAWLAEYGEMGGQDKEALLTDIEVWEDAPKIAVLLPVYNPNKECLVNAIESVLQQLYSNFELCIADDASNKPYVREVLEAYRKKDARVKVIFRSQNGHISAASNSALSLVEADYVALMDHDDLLTPDALYWVAKTIRDTPDVQLIYSDEDKMDLKGQRYAPYFKTDWNPELLLSHNFICHLGAYKTDRVKALGGFDSNFDGAQDYDLVLRYTADLKPEQVVHIPRVLYHWRAVEGSTARGVHEKPYAEACIAKAVSTALERKNRPATVLAHNRLPGALRVQYLLPDVLPLVSIIIPTRNGFSLLSRCVESIFAKTSYANYELIIVDNGSDDFVALRYLQKLQADSRVTIIRDESPFNYSALNNKAVAQAKGDIVALLNNDLEVIHDDWLGEMVSHALHPEVGAVGAKLYYPDDTVQHAGVILGLGGVAGHSHKHFPRDNPGFCGRLLLTQSLSAVTGACLVLRKEVFEAVGGLDEKNLSVAFNDVDLCLRIQEAGLYNIWTPYAELYHHESATRGHEDTPEKKARFNREVEYMKARWKYVLSNDSAYNPNLTVKYEDFSFAWPPRV